MDAQEFEMPSPKRQRTQSPKPALEANLSDTRPEPSLPNLPPNSQDLRTTLEESVMSDVTAIPGLGLPDAQPGLQPTAAKPVPSSSNGFLDVLMQHVESMSQAESKEVLPTIPSEDAEPITTKQDTITELVDEPAIKRVDTRTQQPVATTEEQEPHQEPEVLQQTVKEDAEGTATEAEPAPQAESLTDGTVVHASADSMAATQTHVMTDVQQMGGETATTEGPEWEIDSSPYVSSDSDDSSDTTSDDSDDADGDYAMLDPEEQARILMADGGSDDEGDKKGKTEGGHLRTANEKIEEVIPKPDIVVTEDMNIEELGIVEGVVEKTVLVRAKVSGEYQVLESNSLLCLEDRSVVGVVAEPLGRVEQPMYTIRFTNDEAIQEAGLSENGTKVFYVPQHSTFVFTQPLKAVKGSDASNFHDEEVGDDEMEFSDDEQEAEHKRQMKMKRQGRRDEQGGGRGRGRGGRGNYQRGPRQDYHHAPSEGGSVYGGGPSEISYDDAPDGNDEGYTPLARPVNLSEQMAQVQREPMEGSHYASSYSDRRSSDGGRGRGRGRGRGGDRDRRGGGGRGGRGGGGGGGGDQPSWTTHQPTSAHDSSDYYSHQSPQSMGPPAHFPYQYQQQQQQPHQPRLAPQNQTFSPSPVSPLAPNQFNFNFHQQQQQQQQQQAQHWPGAQMYQQHQYGQQLPQNNAQYGGAPQQFMPGQQPATHWDPNLAGAAHVAAQLEQFRRSQGQ